MREIVAKNKTKIIVVLCTLLIIIATIFIIRGNNKDKFDFRKEFPEYTGEEWCQFAEDGSWMRIDTNPNDEGITRSVVSLGLYLEFEIENINAKLGFPDSVNQKLYGTSYSDGLLEAETDKFKMSWRYSDQRGLELLYEIK